MKPAVTYGARCTYHAARHPNKTALIYVQEDGIEQTVTCSELDQRSNQAARLLSEKGAGGDSLVIVALPTGIEHYYATLGAWKVGACVLPLHHRLPDHERDALIELASGWRPVVIAGNWECDGIASVT